MRSRRAAFPRLQDYLGRPCCIRHSDVVFLVFLQTLDLRGKDTLDTSTIHVFVSSSISLKGIKLAPHIQRISVAAHLLEPDEL